MIGGGDFSTDRIIPDCVRNIYAATENGFDPVIEVRNPASVRLYQHMLEPLFAYLMIAMKQYDDICFSGSYNVGPDDCDCVNTGDLVTMFCNIWNEEENKKTIKWVDNSEQGAPHESNFLKLDCSKIKSAFGWSPRWHIEDAVRETINWARVWRRLLPRR